MLHPGRVEGGPPAPLVVTGELEIVALTRHAGGDRADAGPRSRARNAAPRGHGHTTASEARRSRASPRGVGRVGRSRASRRTDAHGFGKRRPRAASLGEALQDLLPAPFSGEPKCDPAVESDPLELNERRIALRPPRIGQVLLRRVRDGARPQEEGEPARPDDGRFQRAGKFSRETQATGSNARTISAPNVHVIQTLSYWITG